MEGHQPVLPPYPALTPHQPRARPPAQEYPPVPLHHPEPSSGWSPSPTGEEARPHPPLQGRGPIADGGAARAGTSGVAGGWWRIWEIGYHCTLFATAVVFVCQDNHQPRRQQPILRFAPAEAAIEARPPMRLCLVPKQSASGRSERLVRDGCTGGRSFALNLASHSPKGKGANRTPTRARPPAQE